MSPTWHRIEDAGVDRPKRRGVYWIAVLTEYEYYDDKSRSWRTAYDLLVTRSRWDGHYWLDRHRSSSPEDWDGEWGQMTHDASAWTDYSGARKPRAPAYLLLKQPRRKMPR